MTEDKIIFDTLIGGRRVGNTTRQIDSAIQHLFRGEKILARNHHEYGQNRQANNLLFDKILKRLSYEHNLTIENKGIKIDRLKLTIELL